MDQFAKQLAAEARKSEAEAAAFWGNPVFLTDPKVRASYVVSQTAANMLQIASQVVEYLADAKGIDEKQILRNALREKISAARNAEIAGNATGNWEEFDRLAALGDSGSDNEGG